MNGIYFQLFKNKNRCLSFNVFLLINLIIKFSFSQELKTYDLLITEIMSDPTPIVSLPEEEFIEIYNNSNKKIDLSTIRIHVGSKYFTPDSFLLKPDSFIVFWDSHIPTLKNSGDTIKILNQNKIIHSLYYSPSMHTSGFKKNGGWSLELVDFSKPCITKGNWTSSANTSGGSPGKSNSTKQELNPYPIELNSYYPKNDTQLTLVFNVPVETLDIKYKYKLFFNQALINIPKLNYNAIDSISIVNVKTCYSVDFTEMNLKYGMPIIPDSGDIIINELLFNPGENGSDFIEIFNTSDKTVDLSKLSLCKKNDSGELEKPFPLNLNPILLLPKEYYALCPNKYWLKNTFTKANNIIESNIPSMNNDSGNIILITKSAKIIDAVNYSEKWHFSEFTNNENVSLEKINPYNSNKSSNWTSASSFENYATPGYKNSNFISLKKITNYFEVITPIFSPNADGHNDQLIIQYNLSNIQWTAKISVINYSGITIHEIYANALWGKNGTINWNGVMENNAIIKPGIYALYIHLYNTKNQENMQEKITFYVNGPLQ